MNILLHVHLYCFLLSYLVAFGAELAQIIRSRSSAGKMVVVVAMIAGLVAHTSYLFARFQDSGLPPLIGSSHDWLLVLAWLGIAVSLSLAAFSRSSLAMFILPAVLVLVLLATVVDSSPSELGRAVEARRWGMLHAATLVIGIGLVLAATGVALMYLLQYQKLRGHIRWVKKLKLPSLERLNTLNRGLVVACVPLLTIGLLTGVVLVFRTDKAGEFRWSEPIVWGTIMVWLAMVVRLALLLRASELRGRTVARLTLMAGGFLVLTLTGLTLLAGGIHASGSSVGPADSSRPAQSEDEAP